MAVDENNISEIKPYPNPDREDRVKDGISLLVKLVVEEKRWTVAELARQLDVSTNTIWRWKTKQSTWSLVPLIKMCEWTRMSMDALFLNYEEYGDPPPYIDLEEHERAIAKLRQQITERDRKLEITDKVIRHLTEKLDEAEAKLRRGN